MIKRKFIREKEIRDKLSNLIRFELSCVIELINLNVYTLYFAHISNVWFLIILISLVGY